jgi:hypothetical protein
VVDSIEVIPDDGVIRDGYGNTRLISKVGGGTPTMGKSFALTIDAENAAFEPEPGPEVARILREIADELTSQDSGSAMDINGNTVGHWTLRS